MRRTPVGTSRLAGSPPPPVHISSEWTNGPQILTLEGFARSVRRRWPWIIAGAAACWGSVQIDVAFSQPTFRTEATLWLSSGNASVPDSLGKAGVLQSEALLRQAVLASGHNARVEAAPTASDGGPSTGEVRVTQAELGGAVETTLRLTVLFDEHGNYTVQQDGLVLGNGRVGERWEHPLLGWTLTRTGSRASHQETVVVSLQPLAEATRQARDQLRFLVKKRSPTASDYTPLVHITVTDTSAARAEHLLTALIDAFRRLEEDWQASDQAASQGAVEQATRSVSALDEALGQQAKRAHSDTYTEGARRLEAKGRWSAQAEALGLQAREADASETATLASGPLDSAERLAPLATGLVALERARTRLASLLLQRGSNAPEVREQERNVARLAQAARASGSALSRRDSNERALLQSMVGESQAERARTTRAMVARSTFEPVQRVLGDFNGQLMARIARSPARPSRIVSPPSLPERQPSLLETQRDWSALAGALAGLHGVVLEQSLGRRARFRRALSRRVGPHWLAELPDVADLRSAPFQASARRFWQRRAPEPTLAHDARRWRGDALVQWRRATARLHESWREAFPECRLWCVTSPSPGDGQTTVARALAMAAAAGGRSVLLLQSAKGAHQAAFPREPDAKGRGTPVGEEGGYLSTEDLPPGDRDDGTVGAWLEDRVSSHDIVVVDAREALEPLLSPRLWATAAWLLVIREGTPERRWGPHVAEVSRTGRRWAAVSNATRG